MENAQNTYDVEVERFDHSREVYETIVRQCCP